jgi:hypothetical protein
VPRLFGEKRVLRKGLPSLIFASSGRIHEADPLLLPVCRQFTRNTNQWLLDERIVLIPPIENSALVSAQPFRQEKPLILRFVRIGINSALNESLLQRQSSYPS